MIFKVIGQSLPARQRTSWKLLVRQAGINHNPDRLLGFTVVIGVLLGLLVGYDANFFFGIEMWLVAAGTFIVFMLIIFALISIKTERRAADIEEFLPDALMMMSSNLRAGMTIDKALMLSGKQKLGVLRDELVRIGREVNFGKSLSLALQEFSAGVRSEKLETAVLVIISGIKSGGELASLLEQIAKNLRSQEIVEKKTRAAIITYTTYIIIALTLVAPFLFALSVFLVSTLHQVVGGVDVPMTGELPAIMGSSTVSVGFLTFFSVLMLVTGAIMGSFLIGSIMKGKALFGLRYILPLSALSVVFFFLIRFLIDTLLRRLVG